MTKRIGIVAPGRRLEEDVAARLVAFARGFGAGLIVHPQCFLAHGHFAGSDQARADAFVEMANDPAIDAIWFARGGYGAGRIARAVLPRLGETARGKTYLGYSDMGFLLAGLCARGIGHPAHGPVANDIAREGGEDAAARALRFLVSGDAAALEPSTRDGTKATAFNLTILTHLIGTDLLPDLAGRVLMVEEVSEPLYRMDRAFCQLTESGVLGRCAGLRLGRVSDIIPNDVDFGQTPDEIARHWCDRAGVPFLGAADIGHDAGNKVVVMG